MPAAGSADEPEASDGVGLEERIDAALTLTVGTPSPLAEELLDDRRTAMSWWMRLFVPGFVLFTWLVLGMRGEPEPDELVLPLVVSLGALMLALVSGARRWWVEWTRLRRHTADSVFKRRERLLLLGGIGRPAQPNRTPLPPALLRDLACWRVLTAWPDLGLLAGVGAAFYLPMLLGDARRPGVLDIAVWALLAGLVVFAARDTLRTRSRCRRFLADAANPTPEEGG